MCQWLMAKYYDKMMQDAEEKGLREWRSTLLNDLSGDILELGCGTGTNLDFYPEALRRVVLMEPNTHMRKQLHNRLNDYNHHNIEISPCQAENIQFADASFDSVICTLVLCSVKDLGQALSESYRVLKLEGKLIFIEHVAATTNKKRYQWQRRLAFIWKAIAAGCHITRRTEDAIIQAGFELLEITRQSMRGVLSIVRPSIRGIAIKSV